MIEVVLFLSVVFAGFSAEALRNRILDGELINFIIYILAK